MDNIDNVQLFVKEMLAPLLTVFISIVIKPLLPENMHKYIPLISLLLGIGFSFLFIQGLDRRAQLLAGIGLGFSAIGVYETVKSYKKE